MMNRRLGYYIKVFVIIAFIIMSFKLTLYYSLLLIPLGFLLLFNFTTSQIYKVAFIFILCIFIPSLLAFMMINLIEYVFEKVMIYSNKILISFTVSSILLLSVNVSRKINKNIKILLLYLINEDNSLKNHDIRMLHTILSESTIRIFYYFTYFIYAIGIIYFNLIHTGPYNSKQFTTLSYSFTIFFAYDRFLKEVMKYNLNNVLKILK